MSRHCTSTLLLIVLLNLTACKVWYKPGADEEELRVDQQHCEDETQTLDGQVFIECMERLGWRYNHTPAPTGDSKNVSSAAVKNETAPETVLPDQTTPVTATEPQTSRPESPRTTESLDAPKEPARPKSIGSWYNVGADAGRLDDAKSECGQTTAGSATFTECMAGKGWRPIGIRISVEEPDDLD